MKSNGTNDSTKLFSQSHITSNVQKKGLTLSSANLQRVITHLRQSMATFNHSYNYKKNMPSGNNNNWYVNPKQGLHFYDEMEGPTGRVKVKGTKEEDKNLLRRLLMFLTTIKDHQDSDELIANFRRCGATTEIDEKHEDMYGSLRALMSIDDIEYLFPELKEQVDNERDIVQKAKESQKEQMDLFSGHIKMNQANAGGSWTVTSATSGQVIGSNGTANSLTQAELDAQMLKQQMIYEKQKLQKEAEYLKQQMKLNQQHSKYNSYLKNPPTKKWFRKLMP